MDLDLINPSLHRHWQGNLNKLKIIKVKVSYLMMSLVKNNVIILIKFRLSDCS